ncbi:unnamed protein product, partial [Rotaria sp. Silwood1]
PDNTPFPTTGMILLSMPSKQFLSLLSTCNDKCDMNINEDCLIKQLNILKNESNVCDVKLLVLGLAGLNYVIY